MAREDLERYDALAARLDRLAESGGNSSPEADAIRDEMDAPWHAMTEAERDWCREHAGDPLPPPDEHPV